MDNQAKDDAETRKKLVKIGVGWHSDLGYEDERAKATVLIWDNRRLLHSGAGNYPAHERRLHWRVTIMEATAERAHLRRGV